MHGDRSRIVFACSQFLRFGRLQVVSCLFPFALFAGLAVSKYVDLPIARYDALLHPAKFGAWALLVSMSFVLVASVKSLEGRLYHRGTLATVATPKATENSPQHETPSRSGFEASSH